MPPCEIYMHFGLLDEVRKKADKDKLLAFIRSLAHHPNTPGDYVDQDVTLRAAGRTRTTITILTGASNQ